LMDHVEELVVDLGLVLKLHLDLVQIREGILHLQLAIRGRGATGHRRLRRRLHRRGGGARKGALLRLHHRLLRLLRHHRPICSRLRQQTSSSSRNHRRGCRWADLGRQSGRHLRAADAHCRHRRSRRLLRCCRDWGYRCHRCRRRRGGNGFSRLCRGRRCGCGLCRNLLLDGCARHWLVGLIATPKSRAE